MKEPVINCPQCGKTIVWNTTNDFRPFCSKLCKIIDLGKWATGSYRISKTEELETEEIEIKN
ncbi:MAG: DNA gyrase inhibitor YacG [Nitrosomonadaceae bacterium]